MRNLESFENPLIYLITDGTATAANYSQTKQNILQFVKIAAESEIPLIQIREKQIPARMVFEIASESVEIAKNSPTKILINDRADIALAASADGVHLTSNSLSAETIRNNFPENFIVGVSAHTLESAKSAKDQDADFVTFSPIFDSPGKGAAQGIERLKAVCEQLKPFPVVALGGIDEMNFREVLKNGASGFAAIRFLNDENNLRELKRHFQTKNKRIER